MIKGKTSTGFEFEIDEQRANNMEFIDALVELENADEQNAGAVLTAISKLINCLLTKETKTKLYNHVRTEQGVVPIDKVHAEIMEIIRFDGNEEVKNL